MKHITALFLAAAMLNTANAKVITREEYDQLFKDYRACFILYNIKEHKIISEYNPNNRCQERISPNSTFKIPLSLIAFNQGLINQQTVFKWDGHHASIAEHNQDQTPASWLKYSVLWVSQQLTPQLGNARIKHYLAGFNYGNQDFSGGITQAWLSNSLKISAIEQLQFLNTMLNDELPINPTAFDNTKMNLYLGKLDHGADYYGKTGSGRHGRNAEEAKNSLLRDGWFVGFIEKNKQTYIFVSNLTDKKPQATIDPADSNLKPYGSQVLKPIVMKILNANF